MTDRSTVTIRCGLQQLPPPLPHHVDHFSYCHLLPTLHCVDLFQSWRPPPPLLRDSQTLPRELCHHGSPCGASLCHMGYTIGWIHTSKPQKPSSTYQHIGKVIPPVSRKKPKCPDRAWPAIFGLRVWRFTTIVLMTSLLTDVQDKTLSLG